jgi:hypothetical protein
MFAFFFGIFNSNDKINGISVAAFANNIGVESFALSSDALILLFGLLPYHLGLKKRYR